jgi:hypothetical protein
MNRTPCIDCNRISGSSRTEELAQLEDPSPCAFRFRAHLRVEAEQIRVVVLDHCRAGTGWRDDRGVAVKNRQEMRCCCPRIIRVARVERRLAAAGLSPGEDGGNAEPPEKLERGLPHLREEGIHETGAEQLDAHIGISGP